MKLCECGCGQPAPISKESRPSRGLKRGEPKRFINGHSSTRIYPDHPKIDRVEDGCWLWNGFLSVDGYGATTSPLGNKVHRVMYQRIVGPIPEGYDLHHTCEVRNCVNPEHLKPVTHAENVRHSLGGVVEDGVRTRCKRDHDLTTDDAWYVWRDKRECAECRRVRSWSSWSKNLAHSAPDAHSASEVTE